MSHIISKRKRQENTLKWLLFEKAFEQDGPVKQKAIKYLLQNFSHKYTFEKRYSNTKAQILQDGNDVDNHLIKWSKTGYHGSFYGDIQLPCCFKEIIVENKRLPFFGVDETTPEHEQYEENFNAWHTNLMNVLVHQSGLYDKHGCATDYLREAAGEPFEETNESLDRLGPLDPIYHKEPPRKKSHLVPVKPPPTLPTQIRRSKRTKSIKQMRVGDVVSA